MLLISSSLSESQPQLHLLISVLLSVTIHYQDTMLVVPCGFYGITCRLRFYTGNAQLLDHKNLGRTANNQSITWFTWLKKVSTDSVQSSRLSSCLFRGYNFCQLCLWQVTANLNLCPSHPIISGMPIPEYLINWCVPYLLLPKPAHPDSHPSVEACRQP